MINVVLIDNDTLVRQGLRLLLEKDKNIKVLGETKDGQKGKELIEVCCPDIVVLELIIPKITGFQILDYLKHQNKTKALILTNQEEVESIIRAFELGAKGYLLKSSDDITLNKAIHTIYDGGSFIQPELKALLEKQRQGTEEGWAEKKYLTKREIEVLELLAKGHFNKEIAQILKISDKTVKNHLANIFKKIHVNDRTQAVVYAIKNHYVNP